MCDNIKVVVKLRPLISREIDEKLPCQWRVIEDHTLQQLDNNGREFNCFTFDKVYNEKTETKDVYEDIAKPIVEAAVAGINGTIFAYGQTSSGKTYTMTGNDTSPGIVNLAILNLFEMIKIKEDRDFLLRVSYIEIYNETITDLLSTDTKKDIKIHDTHSGIKVDTTEKVVSSPEEVLDIMKMGEKNRKTGVTNMNDQSSRSHSLFQITIESREHTDGEAVDGCVNVSTLNLVDLAGSERAGQMGTTGMRFKEGTHINKSLSALGQVIQQLSEDPHKYINYRNSKLTRILQNSLGGNAKTSIICAVTPAAVEETLSTLQFATRAKVIKNKPVVNAVATDATMIQKLANKLSKLQYMLESKKNLEKDNHELKQTIEILQRQILNGFGQRTHDVARADRRRTWCAPRRMTIDTLHSTTEETSTIPRFCTPALKYNPAMFSSDIPLISSDKMPRLSEESTPQQKKVNFVDEVIELDSDDDKASDQETCSPIHKCYDSSKTPPCVLKEKLKHTQKNLEDIVKFTSVEKNYPPTMMDLMEKLQNNTTVIAKLHDEIDNLQMKCVDKDNEMSILKAQLDKAEDEIKSIAAAKLDVESTCKSYNTKLIEMEVSYESLKNKSKIREEELLSLLEEQKRPLKNGNNALTKTLDKEFNNFMDLSKDISLVVSDNDNSILSFTTTTDKDLSKHSNDLVTDIQAQLCKKDLLIAELEEKLSVQRERIETLENCDKNMQSVFENLKDDVKKMEGDNKMLLSTIQDCNSINKNHKEIKTEKSSVDSENTVKQNTMNNNNLNQIEDTALETLVSNEEILAANNENIRNIIQSLRNAIDARNKEITNLKVLNEEHSLNNIHKSELILELNKEITQLRKQLSENLEEINRLTDINNTLIKSNNEVAIDAENSKKQYLSLNLKCEENAEVITKLLEENEKYSFLASQLETEKKKLVLEIEQLHLQLNNLSSNDKDLQNPVSVDISNFHEEKLSQEYINLMTNKLQGVLTTLTRSAADLHFRPKLSVTDCNLNLNDCVSELELAVVELCSKKDLNRKTSRELQKELTLMTEAHQNRISNLQLSIDALTEAENNHSELRKDMMQKNSQLTINLKETRTKLEEKTKDFDNIVKQLKEENEKIANQLIKVNRDLEDKCTEVKEFCTKIDSLNNSHTDMLLQKAILEENHVKETTELQTKVDELTQANMKYRQEQDKYDKLVIFLQSSIDSLTESHNKLSTEKGNINQEREMLTVNIEVLKKELNEKCNEINDLDIKLQEVIENYQHAIDDKDSVIKSLKEKESDLAEKNYKLEAFLQEREKCYDKFKQSIEELSLSFMKNLSHNNFESIISVKDKEISELLDSLNKVETKLPDKYNEIIRMTEMFTESVIYRENLLKVILDKVIAFTKKYNIENGCVTEVEMNDLSLFTNIPLMLDKVENYIDIVIQKIPESSGNTRSLPFEKALDDAKCTIVELTEINLNLTKDLSLNERKYIKILTEIEAIQTDNKNLKSNLIECNDLLETLQKEIASKSSQLDSNKKEYLNPSLETRYSMTDPINHNLREQVLDFSLENKNTTEDNISLLIKSAGKLSEDTVNKLPKSLLNISLTKIMNALTANDIDYSYLTPSSSNTDIVFANAKTQVQLCQCHLHSSKEEFKQIQEENATLKRNLHFFRLANKTLIEEQKEASEQMKLLQEHIGELHKKIVSHRTNLSTLTATIYAENKALTSELKVLQHHHSRLYNICQKDIPLIKSQIQDVFNVLEGEEVDKYNINRFFSPDKDATVSTSKNDSTLDGDLLMLDTNITLTNSRNTSLVAHDVVQMYLNESPCNKISKLPNKLIPDKLLFSEGDDEYLGISSLIENVHEETLNLTKPLERNEFVVASQRGFCENCNKLNEIIERQKQEAKDLFIHNQKLEKEHNYKSTEITKLSNTLSVKNRDIKQLQEENETLSQQIMDNISEADELRKELDILKDVYKNLKEKHSQNILSEQSNSLSVSEICSKCLTEDKLITTHLSETDPNPIISQCDINTSLRCNKICTLQNELHASREECTNIKKEVATIKSNLERSNLSMSQHLDDSMPECTSFNYTKDFDSFEQLSPSKRTSHMPFIREEKSYDLYASDKADCLAFYIKITGSDKEKIKHDSKIIDVMKLLYNDLIAKHGNEVENLTNKLKYLEDVINQLNIEIKANLTKYSNIHEDLKEKESDMNFTFISSVKKNIETVKEILRNSTDNENNTKLVTLFKDNILNLLDRKFEVSTSVIFDMLIDNLVAKHQNNLSSFIDQYSELQTKMELLTTELTAVNENLNQMKSQLSDKENEYNLLKIQKERVSEISNAVTLDIIRKEQELNETITKGCQKLIEFNILNTADLDLSSSLNKNISLLFEHLILQYTSQESIYQSNLAKENQDLLLKIEFSKSLLEEREKENNALKSQKDMMHEINKVVTLELVRKNDELQNQKTTEMDLKNKLSHFNKQSAVIENLREEIAFLKETIDKKENDLKSIEKNVSYQMCDKSNQISELLTTSQRQQIELAQLKSANEVIINEKNALDLQLETCYKTVKSNNELIENMSAEINSLKQSIQRDFDIIETIKSECNMLKEQNQTKIEENKDLCSKIEDLEAKYKRQCDEYERLNMNIKTHEKTAEIQSSIITKLQSQKDDVMKQVIEKDKHIEDLNNFCATLQKELEALHVSIKDSKEKIDTLQDYKNNLELRLAEMESELDVREKGRTSIESVSVNSRRQRQSLYDSRRTLAENQLDIEDDNKLEAVFAARCQPDDLFMDLGEDSSNKSTPAKNVKRRDSVLDRTESTKEDDGYRSSRVAAVRLRRQSIHDVHRSVGTPSPRESLLATKLTEEEHKLTAEQSESDITKLKETLSSCQQELEELKAKYRELDEECETCAEYLRESDEHCLRLKKEKAALEKTIAELKETLEKCSPNVSTPRTYKSVSVNTDEDWTNLHSVVVDRMSFDMEVEKNKKLTKAVEEFRLKNRELKFKVNKMHKALERQENRNKTEVVEELETTKKELNTKIAELEELKQKYKELDDECEICAENLREREAQCQKLKEAKSLLEVKLKELQDSINGPHATRKKRQSIHDKNRGNNSVHVDSITGTSDDLLSYQAERDDSSRSIAMGNTKTSYVKRLAMMADNIAVRKSASEQPLSEMPQPMPTMLVATGSGIVQNQQITDIMKENQKLKKMNAKLINLCKKGKQVDSNRDNENQQV